MLEQTDFVVSVSAFNSAAVNNVADVLLPAASFMETSGTYVNAEGFWQGFNAVLETKGDARPAWKILRVLGNLTGLDGFDYISSQDVKKEVRSVCEAIELSNAIEIPTSVECVTSSAQMYRCCDVPMYATDAVVRRSHSLQKTPDGQRLCVRLNSAEATRLGVTAASAVTVKQGEDFATLSLVIDDTIPDACAWIPSAVEGNEILGTAFQEVSIEGVGNDGAGA